MTERLERRYRAILRLLPWEHRRRYEDEMVGVLLDGAAEGQRWPRPAEVADLLGTAVRERLRVTRRGLADPHWAIAAATVGLYLAFVMTAIGMRRVLGILGAGWADTMVRQPVGLSDWLRLAIWVGAVLAGALGRRRTAALVGFAGAAAEIGYLAYFTGPAYLHAWQPAVVALVAAGCLGAAAVRGATPVRGRLRLAAVAVGCACAAVSILVAPRYTLAARVDPGLGVLAVGAALFLGALWSLPAPIRRRGLCLLAPIVTFEAIIWMAFLDIGYPGWTYLPVVPFVVAAGAPLLAFALGIVVVRRREERQRLLALGRAADHP